MQLELYSRNRDLEEMKENMTKESGKLRKEGSLLGVQKRKVEGELEEANKACNRLESDLEAARGLVGSLGAEVKRLMEELEMVKEAANMSAVRGREVLKASGLKEPISPSRPLVRIPVPQSTDPPADIGECESLAALDRLIRQLSQGSLT